MHAIWLIYEDFTERGIYFYYYLKKLALSVPTVKQCKGIYGDI
jgi:DUF971 family protein